MRALVLVALALSQAGCYAMVRVVPGVLARPDRPEPWARLTLRDTTRVEVSRPRLVGREIHGRSGNCAGPSCEGVRSSGRVALADLEAIEVPAISPGRSAAAVLGTMFGIGLTIMVFVLILMTKDTGAFGPMTWPGSSGSP
ncbi:MAG: hypothetical protein EPO40_30275 [Myxococcaceae bacterium]|nr:MAG: hypothetical protein EPO40_30275 [Myxococcaceae bacterium]